jgi:ankyrin repeat protein
LSESPFSATMLRKFPIHELVQSGNAAELRAYIANEKKRKRPINLNVVDSENKTPLHVAVQTHRIDIVETLLAEFPDVTLKDADGYTPLHVGTEPLNFTIICPPRKFFTDSFCSLFRDRQ